MAMIDVDGVMKSSGSRTRLPHDKTYGDGGAFVNGKYCPLREAAVPLSDHGFLTCDVVYEKVTVAKRRYFRLQDHFDRLSKSCGKFQLRNPYTDEEMLGIFNTLLRLTGLEAAGVLFCVTRGLEDWLNGKRGEGGPAGRRSNNALYAIVDPYVSIATTEQRQRGLTLMVSKNHIRIAPKAVDPTAKNFHWQDLKLSLFEARDAGKDWSVLTDADGWLTESPGANIFVVKGGALYTPDSGCLEGITRRTVFEIAELMDIPARAEKVHVDQLREADDAFLTSSAGGIMPVNSVDGILLGGADGPGDIAVRFHNLYWEKMWEGWKSTPVNYQEPR
jgi:branched-chain amino acid aminotransferase